MSNINEVHNKKVIDVLRLKKLHYLIKYFKFAVQLEESDKIKIHKMQWKKIMNTIYNEKSTRKDVEDIIYKYLRTWHIDVERKRDVREREYNRIRVSNHRYKKKQMDFKNITVSLDHRIFEKLNDYKKEYDLTYAQAIAKLLKKCS